MRSAAARGVMVLIRGAITSQWLLVTDEER
jgi:hypothetical protein